ncbi:MAG: hypothetical protein ACE5OS_12365 [Anaerolineae bacterium]
MTTQRQPLGLMLLSALLLILALRALGWLLIGGLLGEQGPGLTGGLVGLLITAMFLISAVGLLRLREWARWLTLAICSIYFGLMLVNVVIKWPELCANRTNLSLGVLNGVEAVLVLAMAWWYLNRKDVRRLFQKSGQSR